MRSYYHGDHVSSMRSHFSLSFPILLPGSFSPCMYLETALSVPLIIESAIASVTTLPALGAAVDDAAVANAATLATKLVPIWIA